MNTIHRLQNDDGQWVDKDSGLHELIEWRIILRIYSLQWMQKLM